MSRTSVAACAPAPSNEHHKSLQQDIRAGNVAISIWKYVWDSQFTSSQQEEAHSVLSDC